jgi:signal transduction histidine kinase
MIDQNTIKHWISHLIIFLGIINFILWFSFFQITENIYKNSYNIVEKTITEYGEFDLEYLCKITDCSKIKSNSFKDNLTYSLNEKGILKQTLEDIEIEYSINHFYFDENFNTILWLPNFNLYINLKNNETFKTLFTTYFYINLGFFLIFTFTYFRNTYKEKEQNLLSLIAKEGNIQEKYINLLNENINHELNTPVAILRAKLKKLEMELTNCSGNILNETNCDINTCPFFINIDTKSFTAMYAALDVITNLMERTSNWKQVKYSNGNNSIYTIIKTLVDNLGIITRSNIKFKIADTLEDIVLDGEYKNADLQLCITNLIKNSIEAKATYIYFEGGLHNNELILYVGDNGYGIKDKFGKIITKDKYEKIFDAYYSIKEDDLCDRNNLLLNILCDFKEFLNTQFKFKFEPNKIKQIRGIGTYLNRSTLRQNNGDMIIQETSEKGTVFKLNTKAKIKQKQEKIQ